MELLKKNVKPLIKHEVTETDEQLYDEFMNKGLKEDYIDMIDFRMSLPAYKSKDEIINLIDILELSCRSLYCPQSESLDACQ